MAEYSDSDLKGLMDVFQVKAEIEEAEAGEEDGIHIQEAQEVHGVKDDKDGLMVGASTAQDDNDGYMMVSEENGNQDEPIMLNDEESSLLQDDPEDVQGAFDEESEDLSIMDQNEDPDQSSSVLYNVLSQGASPTMQQLSLGAIKKRFDCRWCKASFTKKTSLRRHMNLHSGSRPFQCPFCEYNATRKDQLKTHIKTRHTRDSSKHFTFKCPLCSNMFQSQKRMTLHMRSHQWDNFPCDLCNIKFKSANELVLHLKRRHPDSGNDNGNYPYVCDVCHRWCPSIEEYVDHIQTHPQKSESVDASPEALEEHDSPKEASRSNGQSRATRISILEQALSKGNSSSSSSRNRYPSESSSGSQRASQMRPVSKVPASSPSSSIYATSSPRPQPTQNSSMLSSLLQGGNARSISPISTNNGPYIVKAVSLHENRDTLRYPHYPVRNHSPLSNSSSARMPPNVVSPTISRDSRESLDVHSPQLSSNSSMNRYQNTKTDSSTQDEVMRCEHCHIIFADSIMYAIHMGCHDWQEPFRCNICAFQCADRYEFMSHITRGLHQKKKSQSEKS